MNSNFIKNIEKELEGTLCIDFDGVIHNHNLGFHDGTIYGDPIEGSLEALKELSLKYKIIIFTCKAHPDRPMIEGKTGVELVWGWLREHNVAQYIKEVTAIKPIASAYIDDKAIRFENWNQCLKDIIK